MQGTVAHFEGEDLNDDLLGRFELDGKDDPKSI
jgi:hypothetical protein